VNGDAGEIRLARARFQKGSLRKEQRKAGATWVLRFYVTRREDGKRVERTVAVGLFRKFSSEAKAWEEVDRLRLLDTVNRDSDSRGRPIQFADIAAHYVRYELGDQSKVMIPRSHSTVSNYRRNLSNRILPRWGKKAALSITSVDIEHWLLGLREEGLANQTCARLKAIMSLVYAHAQRHKLIPAGAENNPLTHKKDGGAGVRCPTKSNYESIVISPSQAYAIWSRLPLAESTLTLLAAATGLRISECLGLQWRDIDLEAQVIRVHRSWAGGKIGKPKTQASRGTVPCGETLMRHLQRWREESPYAQDSDWCFPSFKLKGKQPRVANMLVEDHLRPAAIDAGVLKPDAEGEKVRFGFHTLRHSLASFLVSQNVNPTVVQKTLRHSNVATTLGLYSHASNPERLSAQKVFFGAVSDTMQ
jgi:integrase